MSEQEEIVNLINPDGKLIGMDRADAADAVKSGGYRVPTAEEQQHFNLKETYGKGALTKVKAGVEGALRGASFGASDYVLPNLPGGPTEEAIAARKKFNPGVAMTSEIGGAIIPTLVAPESIAARTPVGLLTRGAEAVEHGIASKIAGAAAKVAGEGTLATKALTSTGKIAAKSLAGAGEGAAFGAGEAFSENALGDPEPLGESLLANMGYGAAWGGALGGLVGLGSQAIPKASSAAKEKLAAGYKKVFGEAIENPVEGGPTYKPGLAQEGLAKAAGFVSPEAEASVKKFSENPEFFKTMDIAEKQKFLKGSKEGLEDIEAATKDYTRNVYEKVKPEAIDEQLGHIPVADKADAIEPFHASLKNAVETLESDASIYSKKHANELKKDLLSFEATIAKKEANAADAFNKMDEIRRKAYETRDKLANLTDLVSNNTLEVINNVFSEARSNLENQAFWGNTAAAQAKLNAAYAERMRARGYIEKGFMRDSGGGKKEFDTTKLESTFNKANDLAGQEKIKHLKDWADAEKKFAEAAEEYHVYAGAESNKEALLKRISGNVSKIEAGAKRFQADKTLGHGKLTDMFTVSAGMLGGIPGAVAAQVYKAVMHPNEALAKLIHIDAATQKVAKTVEKMSKKAFEPIVAAAEKSKEAAKKVLSKEEVDKKIDEVKNRVQSMEKLHEDLSSATDHAVHIAPNITGALQQSMLKGAIFLHSKIPDWSDNSTAMPFDQPKPASKAQNMIFTKYVNAVEDPMLVMRGAVNGEINPEGLEVLENVYPAFYAQMKTSLMNEIVSKKAKNKDLYMPYQKRQAISRFLGLPLDSSQNPANIMANQAILSKGRVEKKQQEAAMATPGGMKDINIAERSLTSAQKREDRETS